jgi:hypothetical protein
MQFVMLTAQAMPAEWYVQDCVVRGEGQPLFCSIPMERVNDFDTAGGRSLGSEFGFFERRKWKVSE